MRHKDPELMKKIHDFAEEYYFSEGYSPSTSEIASAVGIANGVFILLRFREQWIAWYICSILEAVINILSGQMVLLVLKVGYLTNTTYGYIKWTKYINSRKQLNEPAKE